MIVSLARTVFLPIFLLALILLLAAAIGRRVLELLLGDVPEAPTLPKSRLERLVYSTALGLGVLAYLVLALGLVGLLSLVPVICGMLGLLLLCWLGLLHTLLDLMPLARDAEESASPPPRQAGTGWLTGGLLAMIGLLVVINCFVPPAAHEWDALSYHLAAPKIYLEQHRIVYLPTDHHSNFPFLVEMLFTIGLLFDGYALANLFHFACGALCVAALWMLGRRHFTSAAGQMAALAFATTPIVIWEAGAAYIELGMALFALLAFGAVLEYRATQKPAWLRLAGVLMGFALSVKALALLPFVLLGAVIVLGGRPFQIKALLPYLAVAALVGCPFYLKSTIQTGNPVYPFAYGLFGGRNWNAKLAEAYAGSQKAFGLHQNLISASDDLKGLRPDTEALTPSLRLRNMILAPFGLVSVPSVYYDQDLGNFNHLGFLFLALPPFLLLARRVSTAAWMAAGVAGAWFVVWAQTMQYVRYIIPLLPFVFLAGAEGADRFARRGSGQPLFRWIIGAALGLQFLFALSYFGEHLSSNGVNLPGQWELAHDSRARQEYLTRRLNFYASVQWLNQNTPKDAGVVLFEEARGFYLDRPYLWGNGLHSTYIDYEKFRTGREMVDWFLREHIRYALVNMQFSQMGATPTGAGQLREATRTGMLGSLFKDWYDPQRNDERFRKLLGEAVMQGDVVMLPEASQRGTVVLEFRPPSANSGGGQDR